MKLATQYQLSRYGLHCGWRRFDSMEEMKADLQHYFPFGMKLLNRSKYQVTMGLCKSGPWSVMIPTI